ncbi:MAG: methylenetetrahydrofolate reductase, partial [Bdellovibrionales bacterium]
MSKKADMHTKTTSFSIEIFPPKTDAGREKIWTAMERLAELHPEFVSVTCGAGGSAIDGTTSVVHHIRTTYG